MTGDEMRKLISEISVLYPSMRWTKESVGKWYELLKDTPLDKAQAALNDYARSNHFAPTVSDILRGGAKSTSKVRGTDFERGEISEIDMMLIQMQKEKWGEASRNCS